MVTERGHPGKGSLSRAHSRSHSTSFATHFWQHQKVSYLISHHQRTQQPTNQTNQPTNQPTKQKAEGEDKLPPSQIERLAWLNRVGFTTDEKAILCNDMASLLTFIAEWDNGEKRNQFSYLIDGVVVKINDIAQQRELGANNRAPKWAVAYKFKATKAITQLLDIVYQV